MVGMGSGKFPAPPEGFDHFLRLTYGDYMTPPPLPTSRKTSLGSPTSTTLSPCVKSAYWTLSARSKKVNPLAWFVARYKAR